jgi:hypothetical protein
MTERWSGPSRALQAHLELWEVAHHTWGKVNPDEHEQGHVAVLTGAAALHFENISRLSTAFVAPPVIDGQTVADVRDRPDQVYTSANQSRAVTMLEYEYAVANEGVTHYVSEEMMDMITTIANEADAEPIFPTDLPCPHGLIIFEHPMIVPDLHPETGELDDEIWMPVRGIGWIQTAVLDPDDAVALDRDSDAPDKPTDVGVVLIPFTDPESFTEYFLGSLEAKTLLGGNRIEDWSNALQRPMWMIDCMPWQFGMPWDNKRATTTVSYGDEGFERVDTGHTMETTMIGRMRRWFLAFCRLTWQTLIVAEDLRPSRAERRRYERAGKTLEDGYIKVLRLRRRERPLVTSEEDEEREWTLNHRIIVRGHWRRQWYRSMGAARRDDGSQNPESHRLVWIEPHIRGPEDRPLVIGASVSEVIR